MCQKQIQPKHFPSTPLQEGAKEGEGASPYLPVQMSMSSMKREAVKKTKKTLKMGYKQTMKTKKMKKTKKMTMTTMTMKKDGG